MSDHSAARYPHRPNLDGSFDSICTVCFQTIAKSRLESELEATELCHDCHPLALLRLAVATLPPANAVRDSLLPAVIALPPLSEDAL